jgi:hypothetical protein
LPQLAPLFDSYEQEHALRIGCDFILETSFYDLLPVNSRPPYAPGIGDSTAPIAAQCQSFQDDILAQVGDT